jgi:putative oxidoreductase
MLTLSRLLLGAVFFAHGAQKALGWFDGQGLNATLSTFTGHMGIPSPLAVLAILAEFLGGIALILGLFSRIAAFAIGVNMLVAIALVHSQNGFFMNWTGHQSGEGFEFHLLALGLVLVIVTQGAGAFSLDRAIDSWLGNRREYHGTMHPHPSRG